MSIVSLPGFCLHFWKHFLCPIRSRHPLEFLEIARWESVPRGSFTRTWKLSSRLFSRPGWLPLGLRGWTKLEVISRYHEVVRSHFREIAETSLKVTNLHAQSCLETSASFDHYFSYFELPWVAVAQSAESPLIWQVTQVSRFKPRNGQNNNSFFLEKVKE